MPALTITAVDTTTRRLTVPAHGLNTGDGPVAIINTGGALPSGLLPVTDYWVIVVDANTIQLASSVANALAGAAITFTDNGSGTQTLGIGLPYRRPRTYAQLSQLKSVDLNAIFDVLIALWAFLTGQIQTLWNSLNLAGSLVVGGQPLSFNGLTFTANAATDQLTAPAHGLSTGDGPVRLVVNGALAGGLAVFTNYWVIAIDANTLKLATSFANALVGTAIDITSAGSGTQSISRIATTTRAADATVTRNLGVGGTATVGSLAATGSVSASKYTHGVRTIVVPVVPTQVSPSPFVLLSSVIFGQGSSGHWLYAPLSLEVGKRIVALRARVQDSATGPTKVQMQLMSSTDGAQNLTSVATSAQSTGSGLEQTIPMTALAVDVAASTAYYVVVSTPTGTANCSVFRLEVDFIQL
jgi:hypothetical protein